MTELVESLVFSSFKPSEYKMFDFKHDVDPDSHTFKHISDICKYYTDNEFKDDVEIKNEFPYIYILIVEVYM